MAMVPVRVPPSVPVPAVLESEKPRFEPVTLVGLPPASCACTTTGKPTPAAGLLPPLTAVIANLVTAPAVILKLLLVALVRTPLVAVNVYPVPTLSMLQPAKVATPATTVTGFAVQERIAPAV